MVSCTMGSSCSVLEYGMSVRSYQDMIGQGHFALKCAHHFYSTTMTTNWASCDWWDDLVIERITEMALLLPHTFVFTIAFGEHYCTCMTPFTWQVTLSENSGPHVEIFATTRQLTAYTPWSGTWQCRPNHYLNTCPQSQVCLLPQYLSAMLGLLVREGLDQHLWSYIVWLLLKYVFKWEFIMWSSWIIFSSQRKQCVPGLYLGGGAWKWGYSLLGYVTAS